MTTDNNNTDTQPEETAEAIWEMPDYTQTAEALDEMFAELDEEQAARGAAILRHLARWQDEIQTGEE
mgnify:CR=1 FL=1